MRLAFSTLGVPGLPVADAVRLAADNGFDGLELRAHPEEQVHPGIGLSERVGVVEEFKNAGVEILAVAGYTKIAEPGGDDKVQAGLRALLELARDLDAPYVRVFPGGGDTSAEEADATAARRLAKAAPLASDLGVRILLETHDSHRTGADAARVLSAVGHPSAGALWDVLHTWRGGEDPDTTFRLLAPHLGYVQVKDVASAEDTTPLPPGEGVLPLREVVGLLRHAREETPATSGDLEGVEASQYGLRPDSGGWLCWEYEKRWYPEVRELSTLLPGVRAHLRHLLDGDRAH